MSKLDMESENIIDDNIEVIKSRFPNVVVETEKGLVIDFIALKQELSNVIVDDTKEKYQLTWPGKKNSILIANTPSKSTLRPIKEKSVEFDTTENIYIEGDNLEALKILQESYLNKIKCIYIDPPYNTGSNLIYKNDFSINNEEELGNSGLIDNEGNRLITNSKSNGRFHSDWLSMMYSRIKLSRNLLTKNGFIILAIDDSELTNLEKVCNEIFGENNRIGIVTVVHKPEGRNQEKFFGTSNEFMLVYAKDKENAKMEQIVLDNAIAETFEFTDEKGNYRKKNFIRLADGKYATREAKPNFWYPIFVSSDLNNITTAPNQNYIEVYPVIQNGVERTWKTLPSTFMELVNSNDIIAEKDKNGNIVIYEKMRENQVIKTHWIKKEYHAYHFGTKLLDNLLNAKTFDFPKSLYLMIDVLKLFTTSNDIILDFFSGSATTAHAAMQLNASDSGNRKYIMVQLPEKTDEKSEAYKAGYKTICDIGEERIRKAAKKIKEETQADIDYGFRVYKIDSSNMKDVYYKPDELKQESLQLFETNVKEDRNHEDLLTQVMLDLGLTLDLKIEEKSILGNTVYFVDNNSLIACFDDVINLDIINEICKTEPLKMVFKDSSFQSDNDKINLEERVKKLSPETEINIL